MDADTAGDTYPNDETAGGGDRDGDPDRDSDTEASRTNEDARAVLVADAGNTDTGNV